MAHFPSVPSVLDNAIVWMILTFQKFNISKSSWELKEKCLRSAKYLLVSMGQQIMVILSCFPKQPESNRNPIDAGTFYMLRASWTEVQLIDKRTNERCRNWWEEKQKKIGSESVGGEVMVLIFFSIIFLSFKIRKGGISLVVFLIIYGFLN